MWNTYTVENICGATIIDKDWIVTAAHCVETEYVLEETTVRTGSSHITDGGNMYDIQDCFIHPDYNFMSLDNDIALIKLKNSIEFNKRQQPIAIAKPDDIPKINDWMIISGFGKTDDYEDSSEFLKVTKVKVVNYEACNAAYHRAPLTENMFCAGNYEDDACEGDSGGPGVINNKLYGVVSSGEKCGSNIYPGVYTKVYKYYDWIVNTTGLNL